MNRLLKELEEIQKQIDNMRKLENQQKAAGEIRSLQLKAGKIALNYLSEKQGFKEL